MSENYWPIGGGSGTVTDVTGTAPITSTGGATPAIGIDDFDGDSGAGGQAGAVPAPAAGDAAGGKFLAAGGGWSVPATGSGTVTDVTGTAPITSTGGATPAIGIDDFDGDSGAGGQAGAVPAPAAGDAAGGKFLAAGGGWSVPAGSGGSTISVGAIASRPAAGTAGRLYIPNDSFYDFLYDNGSSWEYYRGGKKIAPPDNSTFTWVNQGTAVVTAQTNGAILLTAAAAASDSLKIRYQTPPATPYTKTYRFQCTLIASNFGLCGVGFMEASSGRIIVLQANYSGFAGVSRYSNTTTSAGLNPTYAGQLAFALGSMHLCFRIGDTGTNLTYEYSGDNGNSWIMSLSESRTAYFTSGPDRILFFANANNATYPAAITLISID